MRNRFIAGFCPVFIWMCSRALSRRGLHLPGIEWFGHDPIQVNGTSLGFFQVPDSVLCGMRVWVLSILKMKLQGLWKWVAAKIYLRQARCFVDWLRLIVVVLNSLNGWKPLDTSALYFLPKAQANFFWVQRIVSNPPVWGKKQSPQVLGEA